jgi:hypothetical protein
MIFLIEYDRTDARLVSLREFADTDRAAANSARLARELELHGLPVNREVVVLGADRLDTLKRTHARYFYDVATLATQLLTD